MPEMHYVDFDLLIERRDAGYCARVFDSPAGEAAIEFGIPFSDLEIENFLLRVGRPRRSATRDVRRQDWAEVEAAETFGGRLFEAVFDDEVRSCLNSSLDEVNRQGRGLRIRLRLIDTPELADLPWEFLFNAALRRFLVLSAETPLVRYLELPEPVRPLAMKPPLKVLTMISCPHDYPRIDMEQEWANLNEALGELGHRGLVALDRLEQATLSALQRRLWDEQFHIFHYIGHGDFDERAQDGVLLLEDEHGRGRPVSGQYLGALLRDHRPLRLAILNACEGARASRNDPFAGAAQSLIQQGGVPAVIAMQFEITDAAAITFAHWFYTAVADGYPVDAALAEARKAIFAGGYGVEWATPVLHMRAPDGRIFTVDLEEHLRALEPPRRREEEAPAAPITQRRPLDVATNNLPVSLTSFVGRQRDMAEVKSRLSTARLLTLTGPGGCGKTRLALEVARTVVDDYEDGVWLVELAALEDPSLVAQEVAKVLGVREEAGHSIAEMLENHLRSRQMLLILDNCEHMVETCADLADTLLRACPGLTILATSREVLNIRGEQVWSVPPLSVPYIVALPPVEELRESESVRLFVERAQLNRPGFALTQRNALAVTQICRRLDGLPLAIELAAARVDVLSAEQIAMRLNDRFRLLTRGRRTALPHHQTLRGTVDWSYNLLSEGERTLFNRLSVFAGGLTLEAAEAVGVGDGVETYDILDLLSRLVDKSLVEEEADDSIRYQLLETLRQYGQEQLAVSGELANAQHRHATYFLALVEEAEQALMGPQQATWLDRLESEHDNLRAALRWARESGDAEAGLCLSGALWYFWSVRGYYTEGRRRLTESLALPEASEYMASRAKVLHGIGELAQNQGDYDAARSFLEESLTLFHELKDRQGIAKTLNSLGNTAYWQADLAKSRSFYEESLAIRRDLGDKPGMAASLNNIGLLAWRQGDYTVARSRYEESLAIYRDQGDQRGIALAINNLGSVAGEQGDHAAARALFEESLAIQRALGDRQGIAYALINLGSVAGEQGDYVASRSFLEESLAIQQALGDRWGIATALHDLGDVTYYQGDYAAARSFYEESLAIRQELGDRQGIATSLHNLGRTLYYEGDIGMARSLWEESLSIRRGMGDRQGIAYSLNNLGIVTHEQGDTSAAHPLLEESLAIFRELGHKSGIAHALTNLGNLLLDQCDYTATYSLQEESLRIRQELGDRRGIAESLESFAGLAAQQRQPERALLLAGAAAALRAAIGAPLALTETDRLERHLEPARQALGEETAARVFADGEAMTMEEAIKYTLER
ncbi:MAG: tetratricopeptide repeat protein [Anaerolineae bacterium]